MEAQAQAAAAAAAEAKAKAAAAAAAAEAATLQKQAMDIDDGEAATSSSKKGKSRRKTSTASANSIGDGNASSAADAAADVEAKVHSRGDADKSEEDEEEDVEKSEGRQRKHSRRGEKNSQRKASRTTLKKETEKKKEDEDDVVAVGATASGPHDGDRVQSLRRSGRYQAPAIPSPSITSPEDDASAAKTEQMSDVVLIGAVTLGGDAQRGSVTSNGANGSASGVAKKVAPMFLTKQQREEIEKQKQLEAAREKAATERLRFEEQIRREEQARNSWNEGVLQRMARPAKRYDDNGNVAVDDVGDGSVAIIPARSAFELLARKQQPSLSSSGSGNGDDGSSICSSTQAGVGADMSDTGPRLVYINGVTYIVGYDFISNDTSSNISADGDGGGNTHHNSLSLRHVKVSTLAPWPRATSFGTHTYTPARTGDPAATMETTSPTATDGNVKDGKKTRMRDDDATRWSALPIWKTTSSSLSSSSSAAAEAAAAAPSLPPSSASRARLSLLDSRFLSSLAEAFQTVQSHLAATHGLVTSPTPTHVLVTSPTPTSPAALATLGISAVDSPLHTIRLYVLRLKLLCCRSCCYFFFA